jgi:hypothetical protein
MRRVITLLVFCLMVGSALVGQGRPTESAAEPELGVHAQAGQEVIARSAGGTYDEYFELRAGKSRGAMERERGTGTRMVV